MSDLAAALARFDRAVDVLEGALEENLAKPPEVDPVLTRELDSLKADRVRLESELGTMRADTAMLEAFTDQLVDKVDTAITEIRYILEQ